MFQYMTQVIWKKIKFVEDGGVGQRNAVSETVIPVPRGLASLAFLLVFDHLASVLQRTGCKWL